MLLQKVLNQLKKINLVVQNEVILMPVVQKKKDDWQEFFKDKEPDFSEEGWARKKPKSKKKEFI